MNHIALKTKIAPAVVFSARQNGIVKIRFESSCTVLDFPVPELWITSIELFGNGFARTLSSR